MKASDVLDTGAQTPTVMSSNQLLTVEAAECRTRALRWWSEEELERLAARLTMLIEEWSRDWLGTPHATGDATVAVSRDGRFEGGAEQMSLARWCGTGTGHAARTGATPLGALHQTLFGEARGKLGNAGDHPVVAEEAVQAAWQDWQARWTGLCERLSFVQDPLASVDVVVAAPWSGDVTASFPWCGGEWQIALDGDRVAAVLAVTAGPALQTQVSRDDPATGWAPASLQTALGDEAIQLRTELQGVTLTLGQLQALQVGDVIVLAHALDQPLQILCNDQTFVCHGWLGQQRGQLALELAA